MNLQEILAIAVANVVQETPESTYRKLCRTYSQSFNTPLNEVYELPPDKVALEVFELQLEKMDEEDLDALAESIINPESQEDADKAFDEYIKQAEAQENSKKK